MDIGMGQFCVLENLQTLLSHIITFSLALIRWVCTILVMSNQVIFKQWYSTLHFSHSISTSFFFFPLNKKHFTYDKVMSKLTSRQTLIDPFASSTYLPPQGTLGWNLDYRMYCLGNILQFLRKNSLFGHFSPDCCMCHSSRAPHTIILIYCSCQLIHSSFHRDIIFCLYTSLFKRKSV